MSQPNPDRRRRCADRGADPAPHGRDLHRPELRRARRRVGQSAAGHADRVPQAPQCRGRTERSRPDPARGDNGRLGGRVGRGDRQPGALPRRSRRRSSARRRAGHQQRRLRANVPTWRRRRPVDERQELRGVQPGRPVARAAVRRWRHRAAAPLVGQRLATSGLDDCRHDLRRSPLDLVPESVHGPRTR